VKHVPAAEEIGREKQSRSEGCPGREKGVEKEPPREKECRSGEDEEFSPGCALAAGTRTGAGSAPVVFGVFGGVRRAVPFVVAVRRVVMAVAVRHVVVRVPLPEAEGHAFESAEGAVGMSCHKEHLSVVCRRSFPELRQGGGGKNTETNLFRHTLSRSS
jgi:hypothetical protein